MNSLITQNADGTPILTLRPQTAEEAGLLRRLLSDTRGRLALRRPDGPVDHPDTLELTLAEPTTTDGEPEPGSDPADEDMSVADLQTALAEAGVDYAARDRKPDLIAKLRAARAAGKFQGVEDSQPSGTPVGGDAEDG